MEIIAVLAMDEHRLIGAKNGLPWHIPEDMKRFRDLTHGGVVVMGRNTYNSLPEAYRPLPHRRNIVLSREPFDAVESYQSIDAMLAVLRRESIDRCFVIGGAQIYGEFFQRGWIDRVELTLITGTHDGDVYIDEFRDGFDLVSERAFSQGVFQTLVKKSLKCKYS